MKSSKNAIVSGIIGILVAVCLSAQEVNPVAYVQTDQFKIANITLGSHIIEAEKAFGKPDSIEAVPSKLDSIEEQIYYFNGIIALVSNERITRLECFTPKYKTPKGLKVADSISKLFKIMGKSEIWIIENHKEVHYALWPPCDTYMIFEIQNDKIVKIILDYVP